MRDSGFGSGFDSLTREVTVDELPVTGTLPAWLSGTLVRNGPALFDTDRRSFRHWFDGQAMLHRFTFDHGTVSYANRFLDTPQLRSARDQQRIAYSEFATDPCVSVFRRMFTQVFGGLAPFGGASPTVNPNVSVLAADDRHLALTEVPLAVQFDPETLETLGVVDYDDNLGGQVSTAHPHLDRQTGDLINYALAFGRRSEYRVYRQVPGKPRRELLGVVPAALPGYVHSFAVTGRFAVLAYGPLVVNPLSMALRRRPFIENYRWRPELGGRIAVLDLADGSLCGDHPAPAFFAFHHINAFDDGTRVTMDLCAYPNPGVIQALYLDRLRANRPVPQARPTRLELDLASGDVRVTPLSDTPLELPSIAYRQVNGRRYRLVYGVGSADPDGRDFFDQLCQLDVTTGRTRTWRAAGAYPSEPVFVPSPTAVAEGDGVSPAGVEDDGVVLSVVLDAPNHASFLLVLDAHSFAEVARVEVPHAVPFGLHGRFHSRH